jgi:hypothetical protein
MKSHSFPKRNRERDERRSIDREKMMMDEGRACCQYSDDDATAGSLLRHIPPCGYLSIVFVVAFSLFLVLILNLTKKDPKKDPNPSSKLERNRTIPQLDINND